MKTKIELENEQEHINNAVKKKQWQTPELVIMTADDVQGGAGAFGESIAGSLS